MNKNDPHANLNVIDTRIAALHASIDDAKARCFSRNCDDATRTQLQREVASGRDELKQLLGERRAAARGLFVTMEGDL